MCIHPSISFYILISNKSIDKGGEEGAELNINQEELLIEVKILNVFTFFGVAENFLVCGGKMTNYVNVSFAQVDPDPDQLASPEDVV